MIRIGLCFYLVLMMLAGPALCCCTTQRLMAEFAGVTDGKKPAQSPRIQTCCHQKTSVGRQHGLEQRSNKQDSPLPSPCPCREQGSQFMLQLSADAESTQQLLTKHFLSGLIKFLAVLPGSTSLSLQSDLEMLDEASALPFLSTKDILHTLHILRC